MHVKDVLQDKQINENINDMDCVYITMKIILYKKKNKGKKEIMSFRKYGGLGFNPTNNITHSKISNTSLNSMIWPHSTQIK